jgi:hypothetical protein
VDQVVQHRFLVVRRLSRHLVRLLLYVLHSESSACLNSHVLCLSQFSCQQGSTWTSRITLRSWISHAADATDGQPQPTQQLPPPRAPSTSSDADDDFITLPKIEPGPDQDSHEDAPIVLPVKLENIILTQTNQATGAQERIKLAPEHFRFRLTVLSMVISTNAFGDFSKCTIISETADDVKIANLVVDAHALWQKFVHQPQTARCLVFLLGLGIMCEKIADHYQKAIKQFAKCLILDVSGLVFSCHGSCSEIVFRFNGGWSPPPPCQLSYCQLSSTDRIL